MRIRLNTYLTFLLLLAFSSAWGQAPQDTTKSNAVDIDHSDFYNYVKEDTTDIQYLMGQVELKQDSVYMYCDTAEIRNSTQVIAKGNVLIQQGDSISVFSDSLYYDGDAKIASLFKNVSLINGTQKLFTERLDYDLTTKTATYSNGATLTNDTTQLTSKRGYYYVESNEAFFKDSVVVVDSQFVLRSDTLKFNTSTRVVDFLGPTLIQTDSSKIYTESGFYDMLNREAIFEDDPQFARGEQTGTANIIRYFGDRKEYVMEGDAVFSENDQKATGDLIIFNQLTDVTELRGNARYKDAEQDIVADEIIYDAKNEVYSTKGRSRISDPPQILLADQVDFSEEKGMGVALGNVIWRDTSADLTIVCEQADYKKESGYLKASGGQQGRPLMITLIEGDSLYMVSDTLLSVPADTLEADSSRVLIAYKDVRVYKSNLQAICDSLVYSSVDSIFRFFQDPIIWSDTTQFVADTINMVMDSGRIDKIYLYSNSLIINSPDERFYNQIKGKNIVAHFKENDLRQMDVNGNAESVYYAIDEDDAYVGVNKTVCSEMVLYFANNQVDRIKFLAQPQAKMHPMTQVDHESLKLGGFFWEKKYRPLSVADLFIKHKEKRTRPKTSAGEAKLQAKLDQRPPPRANYPKPTSSGGPGPKKQ